VEYCSGGHEKRVSLAKGERRERRKPQFTLYERLSGKAQRRRGKGFYSSPKTFLRKGKLNLSRPTRVLKKGDLERKRSQFLRSAKKTKGKNDQSPRSASRGRGSPSGKKLNRERRKRTFHTGSDRWAKRGWRSSEGETRAQSLSGKKRKTTQGKRFFHTEGTRTKRGSFANRNAQP